MCEDFEPSYEEDLFERLYRALKIADGELRTHTDSRKPEEAEDTAVLIDETKRYMNFD